MKKGHQYLMSVAEGRWVARQCSWSGVGGEMDKGNGSLGSSTYFRKLKLQFAKGLTSCKSVIFQNCK